MTNTSVILRCIFFWSLYQVLLLVLSPIVPMFPNEWKSFVYGVFGTLSALLISWLFLKYEKRSLREIGLVWQSNTAMRFFKGLLIGSAIFGLILFALISLTPLQLQLNTKAFEPAALPGYLAFIPLSLMEEIGFRSYPFIRLHNRFGLRITQLIIAVVFALYHVVGGQSVIGSFLGPGVYAFVFGLAAVWSGGIAMPLGIHVALNVLQPLTGMRGDSGAVWTLENKSDVISNQMATPETIGLTMQLFVLVATLLLTEYYIRRRHKKLPEGVWNNKNQHEERVYR
jgi:uncharacterized protein